MKNEARTYASGNMAGEMMRNIFLYSQQNKTKQINKNLRSIIINIHFTNFLKFQERRGILQWPNIFKTTIIS